MSRKYSIPIKKELLHHVIKLDTNDQNSDICEIVKFPKLTDCAHFHYESVELKDIKIFIENEDIELDTNGELFFYAKIETSNSNWSIRRSINSFQKMDDQLHSCIYDRNISQLTDLSFYSANNLNIYIILSYLLQFSHLLDSTKNLLTCAPILNWMQMDYKGRQLITFDSEAHVNIPAVAASQAIKSFTASMLDELSFDIGDIISIIDMPLACETSWWRGKKNFKVGFFPSDHVQIIGTSTKFSASTPKLPVLEKRGKFVSLLLSFVTNRPNRLNLKRSGIVKERVFGCDIAEYLTNTQQDVPFVVKCCVEEIEKIGLVGGIYRQSGVMSNVQRLRNEFDADRVPDLNAREVLEDIHCLGSLLKMYFRELPNPLLTYQLYDKFSIIASETQDDVKLTNLKAVVRLLPPPYYRTAKYLFAHLSFISMMTKQTQMDVKNLAIVWAPNLLRRTTIGVNAIKELGIQSCIIQLFIVNFQMIFSDEPIEEAKPLRPKSIAFLPPTPHLISLEEAQLKQRLINNMGCVSSPSSPLAFESSQLKKAGSRDDLRVKDGVGNHLQGSGVETPTYHTIIAHPKDRKKQQKGSNLLNFWNILRSQQNINSSEFYTENDKVNSNIKSPSKIICPSNSQTDLKSHNKFVFDLPNNHPIEIIPCSISSIFSHKSPKDSEYTVQQTISEAHNLENNLSKSSNNDVATISHGPHIESRNTIVKSVLLNNSNQDSMSKNNGEVACSEVINKIIESPDGVTIVRLRKKSDLSSMSSKAHTSMTQAMSKFLETCKDDIDVNLDSIQFPSNASNFRNAFISPTIEKHASIDLWRQFEKANNFLDDSNKTEYFYDQNNDYENLKTFDSSKNVGEKRGNYIRSSSPIGFNKTDENPVILNDYYHSVDQSTVDLGEDMVNSSPVDYADSFVFLPSRVCSIDGPKNIYSKNKASKNDRISLINTDIKSVFLKEEKSSKGSASLYAPFTTIAQFPTANPPVSSNSENDTVEVIYRNCNSSLNINSDYISHDSKIQKAIVPTRNSSAVNDNMNKRNLASGVRPTHRANTSPRSLALPIDSLLIRKSFLNNNVSNDNDCGEQLQVQRLSQHSGISAGSNPVPYATLDQSISLDTRNIDRSNDRESLCADFVTDRMLNSSDLSEEKEDSANDIISPNLPYKKVTLCRKSLPEEKIKDREKFKHMLDKNISNRRSLSSNPVCPSPCPSNE